MPIMWVREESIAPPKHLRPANLLLVTTAMTTRAMRHSWPTKPPLPSMYLAIFFLCLVGLAVITLNGLS